MDSAIEVAEFVVVALSEKLGRSFALTIAEKFIGRRHSNAVLIAKSYSAQSLTFQRGTAPWLANVLASTNQCLRLVSAPLIRREQLSLQLREQSRLTKFSVPKPAANVVCKGELRLPTTITMNRSRFAGFVAHAMLSGTGRCPRAAQRKRPLRQERMA